MTIIMNAIYVAIPRPSHASEEIRIRGIKSTCIVVFLGY